MKKSRISRKQVEAIANVLDLRLISYQRLGNRQNYYYEYSLIRDLDKNDCMKYESIIEFKTLSEIYDHLTGEFNGLFE